MMQFEEMCIMARKRFKADDAEGIGAIYETPDFFIFTPKAEGYGFLAAAFPKNGNEPFMVNPTLELDEKNRIYDGTKRIMVPKRFRNW